MTQQISVRLDDSTAEKLRELAAEAPSQTAAISEAILASWKRLQEAKLLEAYQEAYADNPAYPFESEEERQVSRRRRNAREAGRE